MSVVWFGMAANLPITQIPLIHRLVTQSWIAPMVADLDGLLDDPSVAMAASSSK